MPLPAAVSSVLGRFHARMILRGLTKESANKYCVLMREYFRKNKLNSHNWRNQEVLVQYENWNLVL